MTVPEHTHPAILPYQNMLLFLLNKKKKNRATASHYLDVSYYVIINYNYFCLCKSLSWK